MTMLYHFENEFEMQPSLDWEEISEGYAVELTKNGVPFLARLIESGKTWRLKLINRKTSKYVLELRFRDMSANDALAKAEYYILENME